MSTPDPILEPHPQQCLLNSVLRRRIVETGAPGQPEQVLTVIGIEPLNDAIRKRDRITRAVMRIAA